MFAVWESDMDRKELRSALNLPLKVIALIVGKPYYNLLHFV